MPTVAHWGWNGNARRYWDFVYGAKIAQIERQVHHYGSGLNSLPMLHSYEQNPVNNLYNLRVGFAGNSGSLTNIDQGGFASAAFHSFPELLKWDPYSGDYGPGLLGLTLGQCMYVLRDAVFGDLVFGGDIDEEASRATSVTAAPRDAVRRRVFIADLKLKIELSAGAIQKVVYNRLASEVSLAVVSSSTSDALQATTVVVWLERPGSTSAGYTVAGATAGRGGFLIDVATGNSTVRITKT
jgi:hypothetical protein